jgi:hypothetical protein
MATFAYNIKTDGTVHAKGDGQKVTANLSISNGSAILQTPGSTPFVSGDVTKSIAFTTTTANTPFRSTILSYQNSGQVTLADTFTLTTLSSSSQTLVWGTDDGPAFQAFNDAALAWQNTPNTGLITLTVPAGRYIGYNFTGTAGAFPFANGIKQIVVAGADRTTTFLSNILSTNNGFHLGTASSTYPTNDPTDVVHGAGNFSYPGARTATVAKGATSVTLSTPAQAAWF